MINPVYDRNGRSYVWTLGDQQVVEWKTDLPRYNVSIWQQDPKLKVAYNGGNIFAQTDEKYQVSNFTWTVQLYGFDLDFSNRFIFWVNHGGSDAFTSAYFYIVRNSSTGTTTASTLAPSLSATSTTAPSDQPTAGPTDQPTGLSTTAKLALGLGLGIGIPILAALGVLIWLRAKQLKATQQAAAGLVTSQGTGMQQQRGPNMNIGERPGTDSTGFRSELPQDAGKSLHTELPTQRYE
ncbi:hypothetical protein N7463_000965 [Penicillium fimorum]|uniref:Uncharacterized protein n=1 Tax=Penicillium fimorum TaxID=1882269 RepID=A0A9X0CC19_9EURO|nr:hypothetical protein N7463_000965 [Penicillium fimorum]